MAFVVESANVVCSSVCENNKIRVLHVDDDAEFLEVAKQCLEEQGILMWRRWRQLKKPLRS